MPTTPPTRLVGVAGSLRRGSLNRALLLTAADRLPEGVTLEILSLREIPMYDFDVEREQGFPEPVARLRADVAAADGLLLAVPEYNWSLPGVLKNAIDWLSRGEDSPLNDAVAGVVSAAGGSGGARAQRHLDDVLAHNGVTIVEEALQVARARHHFTDGQLTTPEHLEGLDRVVHRLLDEIASRRAAPAA